MNQASAKSDIVKTVDQNEIILDGFGRDDSMKENIMAAYTSAQKKINARWEGEIGIRYENFNYNLEADDELDDLQVRFDNLFPVLRINHTIDSLRSLQLIYNRRTERANYWLLAGFYTLLDPTLFGSSNTNLRPSFTNSISLNYKHRSVLTSLTFSRTLGAITYYNTVDKEKHLQVVTPINFDQVDRIVLNMNLPIYASKWWEMNWNVGGSYNYVQDISNRLVPYENNIWGYSLQVNSTFTLGKGWIANLFSRYMSPFLQGDQVQSLKPFVNVGLRKSFTNGSSLGVNIQDITNSSVIHDWEYHQPELAIRTFGRTNLSERVVRINYTFNFGNQKLKGKRNRETGSSEERKRM